VNKVTYGENSCVPVRVDTVKGGTYVRSVDNYTKGNTYLVLANRPNSAGMVAINIATGGYETGDMLVIPLPKLTTLTLLVNAEEK